MLSCARAVRAGLPLTFTRQAPAAEADGEWTYAGCSDPGGSLVLASLGCVLSLARVYAKVEFPHREPGRRRGPA